MTKDNNLLGKFELTGIPPAPRGTPQIEVSFELDVNCILKVSAQDKGTGRKESVTIKSDNGRLTKEEIARMIAEAEKFADEDKEARERIEARNSLENYAFSLKNQIEEEEGIGARLDEDEKETVSDSPRSAGMECDAKQESPQLRDAVRAATEWIDEYGTTATAEDFAEQREKLSDVVYPITRKLYGGADTGAAGNGESGDFHDEL
jgi:heat shock protein 5